VEIYCCLSLVYNFCFLCLQSVGTPWLYSSFFTESEEDFWMSSLHSRNNYFFPIKWKYWKDLRGYDKNEIFQTIMHFFSRELEIFGTFWAVFVLEIFVFSIDHEHYVKFYLCAIFLNFYIVFFDSYVCKFQYFTWQFCSLIFFTILLFIFSEILNQENFLF
jgi:hypothetical protein